MTSSDALFVVGLVAVVVLPILVGVWLAKSRCPSCRKLFAGRVTGSSEAASVDTSDWGFDEQRQEYRNISTRRTGYLISRACRFCEHSWQRMESSARQLDRMTDDEAKRYRDGELL